jgi:hypothetical protein
MIIPLIKCNQRTPAMYSKYSVTFLSDHAPLNIPYVFIGWRPVKALAKKKTSLPINKMSKKTEYYTSSCSTYGTEEQPNRQSLRENEPPGGNPVTVLH